jgi:hypothetical protein
MNQNNLNLVLITLILLVIGCACPNNSNNNSRNTTQVNSSPVNTVPATPAPPPTFAELKTKGEKLLTIKKEDHESAVLTEFDEVMTPLREIPKDSKDYKAAQDLNKKLIDKSSIIAAERVVMGEKPAQSSFDGDVGPVKEYLKEALNDYDSSEFVEWSPVTKVYLGKEPYWGVRLKLRAKNAFGAYILRDTYYFMRNNKVVKSQGLGAN